MIVKLLHNGGYNETLSTQEYPVIISSPEIYKEGGLLHIPASVLISHGFHRACGNDYPFLSCEYEVINENV